MSELSQKLIFNPAPSAKELPRLLGLSKSDLQSLAKTLGESNFRGAQIYEWLYKKEAETFNDMTNLSQGFRKTLEDHYSLGRTSPLSVSESSDGTKKYLFPVNQNPQASLSNDESSKSPRLRPDQSRFIESAWIPDADRGTLCISTQVGCKMACLFCATARQGFQGNLDAGQIVNQLLSLPERKSLTNIVYMGMGEPLDNPEGTFESLRLFTAADGINLSSKRITVSSVGVPDALETYLKDFNSHLAISLHSPFDDERRSLMPVQQVHPIKDILDLLKAFSFDDHRRLSFEYLMFKGLNDTAAHAKELLKLVQGLNCRVNLIHYHSVPGNTLEGTPRPQMEVFQNILKEKGQICTIRKSRGEDIQAACGLLSTKALQNPPKERDF